MANKEELYKEMVIAEIQKWAKVITDAGYGHIRFTHDGLPADVAEARILVEEADKGRL